MLFYTFLYWGGGEYEQPDRFFGPAFGLWYQFMCTYNTGFDCRTCVMGSHLRGRIWHCCVPLPVLVDGLAVCLCVCVCLSVPVQLCVDIRVLGVPACACSVQNNKDYFDQSLDEIKLLKFVNDLDPNDEHALVRLYDYFYYKVGSFFLGGQINDHTELSLLLSPSYGIYPSISFNGRPS